MQTTRNIALPDFREQQPLGQDGLLERVSGLYRARPAVAGRLLESAARAPGVVESFLRLTSDLAALGEDLHREPPPWAHAHVAEVLFHGRDSQGEPAVVVAMPQGGSLLRAQNAGRWSEAAALHLATQLIETLLIANRRGLYCCALCPTHLFVTAAHDGAARSLPAGLTLLNLGLTAIELAFYQATGERELGLSEEELAYRAPELRRDPARLDEAAEVFSLGALLHFLILGRLRPGTTSTKVGIHQDVRTLLLEMLAMQPEARPGLRDVHQRILAVIAKLSDFEVQDTAWQMSEASLHRALQISTQRTGWLRVLPPRLATAQRAQLAAVRQSLQDAPQPGVLPTWELGEQPDRSPYLFSSATGTRTLRSYVTSHGPLGRAALRVVEGIARTLRSLHRHDWLYLGLCPDNVVVEEPEQTAAQVEHTHRPRCWLLQTEYAQSLKCTANATGRTIVQEPHPAPPASLAPYLAPEQYDQSAAVAERADVHALGSLLCFLLTGQEPPLHSVELGPKLGIDRMLHEILVKLLNRMRARRAADRPTPDEAVRSLTWLSRLDELMHGELLEGKYRIDRPLALGGMNALFVVTDVQLGRQAVLKCPFPDLPIALGRARQEAEAATLARRGNPAVVDILQYGELDPEVPYLLMEMVDGELLTDFFKQRGAPLLEQEVVALGINIAGTMDEVHHKGVIHRDLKPDNLMLERDRTSSAGVRVRILDFGIARLVAEQYAVRRRLTGVGSFMGTPDFMAPEQGIDASRVSDRADVFSLGVIMYYLLGGPLPAAQPLQPVGSSKLMALLAQMVAFLPTLRPSMAEVGTRLRALSQERSLPYRTLLWPSACAFSIGAVLSLLPISQCGEDVSAPVDLAAPLLSDRADLAAAPVRNQPLADLGVAPDLLARRDLADVPELKHTHRYIPKSPPPPQCPPHFKLSCVRGEGLSDDQRQTIADLANRMRLPICGNHRLRLTKLIWYLPEPETEATKQFVDSLASYWRIKNYAVTPTEIVISCQQ